MKSSFFEPRTNCLPHMMCFSQGCRLQHVYVENLSNFRSFSSSIYYQYGIVPDSYISTAVHLLNKEPNFYFCRPIVMTEFQTIILMLDQLRMGLESFCLLEALQSKAVHSSNQQGISSLIVWWLSLVRMAPMQKLKKLTSLNTSMTS